MTATGAGLDKELNCLLLKYGPQSLPLQRCCAVARGLWQLQHACSTGALTALQWLQWRASQHCILQCWRAVNSVVVDSGIGALWALWAPVATGAYSALTCPIAHCCGASHHVSASQDRWHLATKIPALSTTLWQRCGSRWNLALPQHFSFCSLVISCVFQGAQT